MLEGQKSLLTFRLQHMNVSEQATLLGRVKTLWLPDLVSRLRSSGIESRVTRLYPGVVTVIEPGTYH